MNVNSLNVAPKPSGNKPIDGSHVLSPEKRDDPNNFANALKSQDKFFKGTKHHEDPPQAQQSIEKRSNGNDAQDKPCKEPKPKEDAPKAQQSIEKRPNGGDVKANRENDNHELAALIEKYLPPATADKETPTANPAATLATLTNEPGTAAQNNPPADASSTTQDISNAIALTGLAFAKPTPEQAKLTISGENVAPEVSLQKATVLGQPMQASQPVNLPSADSSETFKQTLTSLAGSEQKAPEVSAEMLPTPKPIDTRMDSPAITKPLSHPGWGKDLSEHIIWMNNKDISAAEIKLNPVHLGPISVRIDMGQDNQASIQFTAQHAETKEALENSIPKLKEMLLGQQLNLVNVNISQNPSSNNGRPSPQPFYGTPGNPNNPNPESLPNPLDLSEHSQVVTKGLLSLYA